MKKIVLLLVGLLISCLSFGQTKIWSSDFSKSTDWEIVNNSATGSLNWSVSSAMPTSPNLSKWLTYIGNTFNSYSKGSFALLDGSTKGAGNRTAYIATTNPVDLTNKPKVNLKFYQLYARYKDVTSVEVSSDNSVWTPVYSNSKLVANQSTKNPEVVIVDISSVAGGKSTVWIRFKYVGTTGDYDYAWFVDDVSIEEIPQNDISAISGIIKGQSQYIQSCLGQEELSVYVVNKGQASIQNGTPVSYKVNSNSIVTESAVWLDYKTKQPKSSLAFGDTAIHVFKTRADFSKQSVYEIKLFGTLGEDEYAPNDTVVIGISSLIAKVVDNNASYTENFEASNYAGFTSEDVDNKGYKFSTAAGGNKKIISTAASTAASCIRINDGVGPTDDWAFSPCLILKPGLKYSLSYYTRLSPNVAAGANNPAYNYSANLQTKIGTTASSTGMTQLIEASRSLVNDTAYANSKATFTVSDSAIYYLGFNVVNTDASKYVAVRIDDISLTGKGYLADINSFSFNSPFVKGIINGKNITLSLSSGIDLKTLIASFNVSPGAIVKVLNKIQVSGNTTNDFTSVVTYTVTSEDGLTTNEYMVTVNVQQSTNSSEKDFLTYVINGVSGVISTVNKTISVTLPSGTLLNNLTAKYTTSPKSSITTGSNTTDFTNPVTYVITAEDGSTKTYTVTVTLEQVTLSNQCDMTTFTLGLTQGTINNNQITVTLPNGSNLTQAASFVVSKGSTVKVNGVIQQSGVTSNTYSTDLIYEVTAEDGQTKKIYTVKVTVASAPVVGCKDLDNWKDGSNTKSALYATDSTGYSGNGYFTGTGTNYFQGIYEKFETLKNDSKTYKLNSIKYSFGVLVSGNDTNTIQFVGYLPAPGTDLPGKVKLFSKRILVKTVKSNLTSTGDYLLDLSADNLKVKGSFYAGIQYKYRKGWKTPNVGQDTIALYTNTAGAQGSTINSAYCMYKTSATDTTFDTIMPTAYKFSLGVYANVCDLSSANDLLSFNFTSPSGSVSTNGTSISITLPSGTDPSKLSSLVAIFSSSPKTTVTISQVNQVSGQTSNDFTTSKVYTVTAEDGSKKDYTVTVTIEKPQAQKSSAKDFVTFSINGKVGVISTNTISVVLPSGTILTNLTPSYTTSDKATVTSGASITNFSNPVTYVITAEDGTTKSYTVTITVGSTNTSSGADILTFGFANPNVTGVITGNAIAVSVPYGTNVKSLVSTFTTSTGAIVKVSSILQNSGGSVIDYSTPVTFTVTSQDGKTVKTYTVSVTITPLLSSAKEMLSFGFASPNAIGTISGNTIGLTVPYGTNLAALVANFTSSPNSIVRVGSTVQVSGTTPNSFVSSLMYTVVAQDGSAKDYTVVVTVSTQSGGSGSSAKDILSFGLLNPYISGTISGNTITIKGQAGSDITKQQISFSISPGATLKLNGVIQTTNISIVNFSNPVTLTVTAADGSTKEYIVTVTIPKKSEKAFTFFRFIESPSAVGVIDEAKKTITVHVPNSFANNLNFTAVFGVSAGAIVKLGNIQQSSGASQLPYKSKVVFTVVAEDGTTADYTIIIIVDPQVAGIEEEDMNALVRIYPNPSTGVFTCESAIESYDLTITDILGHTVYNTRVESNGTGVHMFDLSSFGSGVYFATLQNGTSSKLIKIEVIQ